MNIKALIIAAGKGSRLESLTKDEPKPLIQLLGLS
ncbi:MAG TPA: mannose-1-phosphate guanylyltransferase, partial [Methanophagales archaeon]|nr:mannose-1-phosphate guanylyltransferase [Methanophagales archaeon]